ncbi:hypothetical protein D7S89_25380 [Trinickia fusca]|uniref:Uncharacterized protein n=1 Tax=Trinickia fusca TaxID=2419777 RepID=A0A494WYG0_9BURK|nr:hypothetical protein D7S89_25380 [Trinickia fusca]
MLLPRPEIRITIFFIRRFYHSGGPSQAAPPRSPPSVYNLLLCGACRPRIDVWLRGLCAATPEPVT